MFGLEWSAAENTLTVTPSLPAQWNEAKISGVPMADRRVGIEMRRNGSTLLVRVTGDGSKSIKLRSLTSGATGENGELRIPLPLAEVGIGHGLPQPGAVTAQMKILDQQKSPRSLRLRLAAPANSQRTLFLRINDPKIHPRVEGAELSTASAELLVRFPSGDGYVERVVTVSW
jgi:hypothetical protein